MQFNLHVYVIKWFWYNSTNMSRRFVPLKNIQTALAIQLFNISNGSHYNLVTSKFGNSVSFVKSLRNDLSQTFYTNVMQLFPPAHYVTIGLYCHSYDDPHTFARHFKKPNSYPDSFILHTLNTMQQAKETTNQIQEQKL